MKKYFYLLLITIGFFTITNQALAETTLNGQLREIKGDILTDAQSQVILYCADHQESKSTEINIEDGTFTVRVDGDCLYELTFTDFDINETDIYLRNYETVSMDFYIPATQTLGSVMGTLMNNDEMAINENVNLRSNQIEANQYDFETATNENGQFTFTVPAGSYDLSIPSFSLTNNYKNIEITANETLDLETITNTNADRGTQIYLLKEKDGEIKYLKADSGTLVGVSESGLYVTTSLTNDKYKISGLDLSAGENWTIKIAAVSDNVLYYGATSITNSKLKQYLVLDAIYDGTNNEDHTINDYYQVNEDNTITLDDGSEIFLPAYSLGTEGEINLRIKKITAVDGEYFPTNGYYYKASIDGADELQYLNLYATYSIVEQIIPDVADNVTTDSGYHPMLEESARRWSNLSDYFTDETGENNTITFSTAKLSSFGLMTSLLSDTQEPSKKTQANLLTAYKLEKVSKLKVEKIKKIINGKNKNKTKFSASWKKVSDTNYYQLEIIKKNIKTRTSTTIKTYKISSSKKTTAPHKTYYLKTNKKYKYYARTRAVAKIFGPYSKKVLFQ
ncbi:MAG: carboxypeptidase-like regulatory domain-containing protein [Patescibacteria group bacterium]